MSYSESYGVYLANVTKRERDGRRERERFVREGVQFASKNLTRPRKTTVFKIF